MTPIFDQLITVGGTDWATTTNTTSPYTLLALPVASYSKVVGAIGLLCMIFGAFVLLMMLVPNEGIKRLAFLFCGGIVFSVGWLLRRVAKRHQEKAV